MGRTTGNVINQFVGPQTSDQLIYVLVNRQNSIKQEAMGHQDTDCHHGAVLMIAFTLNLYYEESGAAGS